jgi:regulator of protease activity HflC (stomatin/prohibitin superfamily)
MRRCAIALCLYTLGGCTQAAPGQGQEAVVIEKPWFFGHGGVYAKPVLTGREYFAASASAVYVDVQPQQFAIHFDDFMSRDGVPLDFDVALGLRITDSVRMVRDFGIDVMTLRVDKTTYQYPKWYVNNVHKPLENFVRQAVRKHGMNETAIDTRAIEDIDREITAHLSAYIQDIKLPAQITAFTVGRANPPDAVKHQRIETATQEQRVNTERQRRLAEVERKAAEEARAAADNVYRISLGYSPAQYLRFKEIQMQWAVCANANARCVFTTAGTSPVIDVGR